MGARPRPAPATACCARCSELVVEGIHTTVPAHELVLAHPDFAAGHHSTNWLENEVDLSGLDLRAPARGRGRRPRATTRCVERTVPVEVDGKRFAVKVWLPDAPVVGARRRCAAAKRAPKPKAAASTRQRRQRHDHRADAGHDREGARRTSGDTVEAGQALLVLEAMKMENHINAEQRRDRRRGPGRAGDSVGTGDVLVIIE